MKFWLLVSIAFLLSIELTAQDNSLEKRPIELSFEYQMYPAGMMPGVKMEIGVGKYYKHSMNVRIAYNRAKRHGWGEHGDERGGGLGASIGYRFYIIRPMKGLYAGVRSDFWNMKINYRDIGEDMSYGTADDSDFGSTKIFILQPTVEIGYKFLIPVGEKTTLFITPQIAAGWEYNAITNGEAVGQGAIGLWGIDLGIRF
ncbi:MAG: hypothetical protein ACI94Y_003635 [Maribacter sp.]|jgi:hypothetical protein